MAKKILGLDLGTNSIGTSIRNIDLGDNLLDQLEYFSSDIFKAGVGKDPKGEYSFAAERTKHVQSRRLNDTRRRKLWATLELFTEHDLCPIDSESLIQWKTYDKKKGLFRTYPIEDKAFNAWIMLDFNGDGIPDYTSPYQLRKELATIQFDFSQPIDRYKLGRALYHIAQHRGFKSSKGQTIADQEKDDKKVILEDGVDIMAKMKASEEKIAKGLQGYIKENNLKTVGEAFAKLEDEGVRIRNNAEYKAIRSQFKEEIEYIFKFQKDLDVDSELYRRLTSEKKGEGTIFYKKPLKSQRGLVGYCTLEKNKSRCPVGHPEFEKFRAWSLINNIKIKDGSDQYETLPCKLKEELYNELFLSRVKSDFDFKDIRLFLEKRLGLHFDYKNKTINYKDNTNISSCPVTARLIKILGENWEKTKIEGQKERKTHGNNSNALHKVNYDAYDLWHVCYDSDDPEAVIEFACQSLNWDEKQAKALSRLWSTIPQGYGMLSLKAIHNINRMLLLGFRYSDAVFLAKIPDTVELCDDEIKAISNDFCLLEKEVNLQKRIDNVVNSLIAQYKSMPERDRFADRNYSYVLDDSDEKDIIRQIENIFGKIDWELMDADEQLTILNTVRIKYQEFFQNPNRTFVSSPKIGERLVEYLSEKYPSVESKKWDKLYHPSQISVYRPVPAIDDHSELRLGSPNIGSIKNPVALRTLNMLRKKVNKLLDDGLISPDDTRIVVETTRHLNDANRRWAIDTYQREREKENQKIKEILEELDSKRSISDVDIDSVRYVVEQGKASLYKENKSKVFAKDVDRYKLWLEQDCQCLYTGNVINLKSLFDPNVYDIEHTIPRSKSFDSSDQNLTICDSHYNRSIKKNHIPTEMPNYDRDIVINGVEYTAIKPRLERWEEKVDRLNKNVEFWKSQSKKAQEKTRKDYCIRQKHLWKMELDYWQSKLDRFTMTETTDGFKNSQLVDTGIITRHAVLFLKSIFKNVDVEKGKTTDEFRKIFGFQKTDEKKSRLQHSHHAIDATVLTMIPVSAKRDRMLALFYKIQEQEQAVKHGYINDTSSLEILKKQLAKEVSSCQTGRNLSAIPDFINENIIVRHFSKDQTLTPAHRKVRMRGKVVGDKNNPRWSTGDSIRGKIHEASYYGAITQYAKDNEQYVVENGKIKIDPTLKFVIRRELKYKKSSQDSGFKTWEDVENQIVNKKLVPMMKSQYPENISFKDACESGIYMLDKKLNKINKIRHIRCYASVTGLRIKEQTYKSEKEYKQYFYAAVGDLYSMCSYTNGKERDFKIYSIYEIVENRKAGLEDIPEFITNKKGHRLCLDYKLCTDDMILIYKDNPEELKEMDQICLKRRLYTVNGFENDGLRIKLSYHLSAKEGKGEAIKDFNGLPEIIRCGIRTLKFLVMGEKRDFIINKDKIEFNH